MAETVQSLRLRMAEQYAAMWLYRGNLASERGEHAKAERCYERSQKWMDEMNDRLGNGDKYDPRDIAILAGDPSL